MSYLKDFQATITQHDYPRLLRLWEEYCSADEVDAEELRDILKVIKGSQFAELFGRHVERIVPLWKNLPSSPLTDENLKLIIDLQTTNSDLFAQLAYAFLKERYGEEKTFADKIKMSGLRGKENFQGAISNYELLSHIEKGNFVFHTGGWGVGEIIDFSVLREEIILEFDYVPGRKSISFATAFKVLYPIPQGHFLALRFGNADLLEEKARKEPVEVIRMLLSDLGPKTAAEIKDELCDLVIPAAEWTKWWQGTRAKLKKDTLIETPEELKNPFRIRKKEMSHEDKMKQVLEGHHEIQVLIDIVYTFIKDFSETLKNKDFAAVLAKKLEEALKLPNLSVSETLQLHFFLQDVTHAKEYPAISELVRKAVSIPELIEGIKILNFKKRTLVEARAVKSDWKDIFLSLLFKVGAGPLRDYMFGELVAEGAEKELVSALDKLLIRPFEAPDAFIWYFQKASVKPDARLGGKITKVRLFEGLLILLSAIELDPEYKELTRKIHGMLSAGRYAIVREIMQEASLEDVKEFLLLVTKCHTLGDHDLKILHSLAEVAHPSLAKKGTVQDSASQEIWTTQEGYQKLKARIEKIATVETVENAREIEVARSHGDLRENAEFKAALEKRSRLQSELKTLSDQLSHARVLTPVDVSTEAVGVGVVVECKTSRAKKISYTILGPWDADTERHILSLQSKLAQTMLGLKVGQTFQFQNEEYTIERIRSFFEG